MPATGVGSLRYRGLTEFAVQVKGVEAFGEPTIDWMPRPFRDSNHERKQTSALDRPDRNMALFYTMSVQPTLFGEWALFRERNPIGSAGRLVSGRFASV
jgi:hypothetical protein